MKIIISLLFFVLYVHNSIAQNEVLSTNIYRKVMHVYENHIPVDALLDPRAQADIDETLLQAVRSGDRGHILEEGPKPRDRIFDR